MKVRIYVNGYYEKKTKLHLLYNIQVHVLKSEHLVICCRTVLIGAQCGNVQGLIGVVVGAAEP